MQISKAATIVKYTIVQYARTKINLFSPVYVNIRTVATSTVKYYEKNSDKLTLRTEANRTIKMSVLCEITMTCRKWVDLGANIHQKTQ